MAAEPLQHIRPTVPEEKPAAAAVGSLPERPLCQRLQDLVAELPEPLQEHLLPQLSTSTAAALRSSCQAMSKLFDSAPTRSLQRSFGCLLPPGIRQYAKSGHDIQSMLKQQAAILADLRSGKRHRIDGRVRKQRFQLPNDLLPDEVLWSPEWPSRHIAISAGKDNAPASRSVHVLNAGTLQPNSACDSTKAPAPLQGSWVRWCSDAAHIVAETTARPDLHRSFVSADAAGGAQHHFKRDVSFDEFNANVVSPSGNCLILQEDVPRPGWQVLTLPDLATSARINSQDIAGLHPNLKPLRMRISPAGQYFAVSWAAAATADLSVAAFVSLHANVTGQLLSSFQVPAQQQAPRNSQVSRVPEFTWSPCPDRPVVLFVKNGCPGSQALYSVDGQCTVLPAHPSKHITSCTSLWSPCGRYVQVIQELLMASDPLVPPGHSIASVYIWDAEHGVKRCEWHSYGPRYSTQLEWSSAKTADGSSICLVLRSDQSKREIMALHPSDASARGIRSRAYRGPTPHGSNTAPWSFTFSPEGRWLILYEALHEGTGYLSEADQFAIQESIEEEDDFHAHEMNKLSMGELNTEKLTCEMLPIATWPESLDMSRLAWHPSPMAQGMCAIPSLDGGMVYLVNGAYPRYTNVKRSEDRLMRIWRPKDLLHGAEGVDQKPEIVDLAWSPDGSQLAYSVPGALVVLYFWSSG